MARTTTSQRTENGIQRSFVLIHDPANDIETPIEMPVHYLILAFTQVVRSETRSKKQNTNRTPLSAQPTCVRLFSPLAQTRWSAGCTAFSESCACFPAPGVIRRRQFTCS